MSSSVHTAPAKILFINLYTEMGGGEYAMYHLLKGMDRSRFKPVMMFNQRGPFVEKVESIGVQTVIIPFRTVMLKRLIRPKEFASAMRTSFELCGYIQQEKFDLVHCTDVLSLVFLWRAMISKRIPVVYNVIFFYEWTRVLLFNLLALLFVKRIVTNSFAIRKDLISRTVLLSRKFDTVYYGIDTSMFTPRVNGDVNSFRSSFNLEEGKQLVGMVARFDTWKGHKTFLSAVVSVLKQRSDVQFVVVGGLLNPASVPDLQLYYNDVMNYRKELGLEEKIPFIDHQSNMPEVLRGLDVLVCPSFREPIPMIVFEAMASGVPVIGADSGGIPEQIENGIDGYLFRTGDASSLEAAMIRCLDAKEERAKIAVVARAKMENKFSMQRYVNDMQNCYSRIVEAA